VEVQALGLRPSKYPTTTQDAAAAQDPDPRSRAFMLPDPELPLSDKDLPRLLELRRKSYFKIKRTYVRRDVQYARCRESKRKMSGITDSEDQLNVLWRRKEPKTNNTNLGIGFAPQRIGESTLEGYQNKLQFKRR